MISKMFKFSNLSITSQYSKDNLISCLLTIRDVIESSFDKILEIKLKKPFKIEEKAKSFIFDNFVDIITGLCTPKLPSNLVEVENRLIRLKLQLLNDDLESVKNIAIKGKKNKICLPYEKILRVWNQFLDPCVILFILAIIENIIETYLRLGLEYQSRTIPDETEWIKFNTIQIIISKYHVMEQPRYPIYDTINKLSKQFSQNYRDNIKNFLIFLKECREQLEVLKKVFLKPLEKEENIQKVFGNIRDVLDCLGFVVEALDDSTDSTRRFIAMDILDLAEMETFLPFEQYAESVILLKEERNTIFNLLKSEVVQEKLIRHYNDIIKTVFVKKRKDLMVRYRILHYCQSCSNPLGSIRNNSFSLGSTIEERRSLDSGYISAHQQLSVTVNSDLLPSSTSSSTNSSESPHTTRGPSPMSTDYTEFPKQNSPRTCNLLVNCYKHLLPRMLFFPIFQFLYIYQILEDMTKCNFSSTEIEEMQELENLLNATRLMMPRWTTFEKVLNMYPNLHNELSRLQSFYRIGSLSLEFTKDSNNKLNEIKKLVKKEPENWEWPSGAMSEFIMEGPVCVRLENKKLAERYLYLFSNMLLVCKKVVRKTGIGGAFELKLKSRINLAQFHIFDEFDDQYGDMEYPFSFSIEYLEKEGKQSNSTGSSPSPSQRRLDKSRPFSIRENKSLAGSTQTLASMHTITDQDSLSNQSGTISIVCDPPKQTSIITFCLAVHEDKVDWVATLLQIQTKKLFSQYVILKNTEEIPLRLPDPEIYKFAELDTSYNIEYELGGNDNSADIPVIRAATLEKLITHLTSHSYYDGKTLNSFLLIFRNFTTPSELLDLLIERFNIPDPTFTESEKKRLPYGLSSQADRMLKKFRTVYRRKVQLRVINFVTKWINNPSYFKINFASDPSLLEKLQIFLDTNMLSAHLATKIKMVKKNIDCRLKDSYPQPQLSQNLDKRPQSINLNLCNSPDDVSVINIHPLELARQITLYEWKLYSKIEFWEVHGRENQEGPNFHASTDFSNKILYWLIYEIMQRRNMQDRITAILRVADLMQIFEQLNNLQGAQECKGALISASVYRLKDTFDTISYKFKSTYRSIFDKLRNDYQENSDSYIAQYQKKIHAISAPGLPYIAMGDKTHLIHMNLKNPNYFTKRNPKTEADVKLINFWKFRQMSELIEHYLSFQTTPYNFQEVPMIQTFLNNLDPFKMVKVTNHYEFDDFAHNESIVIQPRIGEANLNAERTMTEDEIKLNNHLNSLSLKEKMSDTFKMTVTESPPPLPPKRRISESKSKSGTPEPVNNCIPDRPPPLKRDILESNQLTVNTSGSLVVSEPSLSTYNPKFDNYSSRPPPVPTRSLSRESKNSPPPLPPKCPPLPPKSADTI